MPNSCCDSSKNDHLWIAIGDVHDDARNLARIPELAQAEAIIVSGDLTTCGNVDRYEKMFAQLAANKIPVLAQLGNMDLPEVDSWLNEHGVNLHGTVRELAPGIAIFGIGGSTPTPMNTPTEYSEEAYAKWLEDEWQKASACPHKILVSHNPPKDTPCDRINDKLHPGSEAVRKFIEEKQPDICICGHIHEGRAIIKMGATTVVNPGMLADGGYVVLRASNGCLTAELCEIA